MPISAEDAAERLLPRCQNSTLESLVKLAGMNDAKPGVRVPAAFFWNNSDKLWLLTRDLIREERQCYVITEPGEATVSLLRQGLAAMYP